MGTRGTIREVFKHAQDLYQVQFDDLAHPRLIYGKQLERVADDAG
jgi:hypothetical protein